MARDYGRVFCSFWTNADMRDLSDRGKLLATYLLSCPHSNIIGAYLLPDAYVADDLGWSSETVSKGLAELFKRGFARRFKDGRHIVICKFLAWNPIENPNVAKAALKQLEQLPKDPAIQHVIDGLHLYEKHFPNGLETALKPFRNMEMEQDMEIEQEPEQEMEQDSCAAPSALALVASRSIESSFPEPFIRLPTNLNGREFSVTVEQVEEFEKLYPAVDVRQEFRAMRAWLLNNREKRKTEKGMPRFMNNWLSKQQDRGHGNRRERPAQRSDAIRGGLAGFLGADEGDPGEDSVSGTQPGPRAIGDVQRAIGGEEANHHQAGIGAADGTDRQRVPLAAAGPKGDDLEIPSFLRRAV